MISGCRFGIHLEVQSKCGFDLETLSQCSAQFQQENGRRNWFLSAYFRGSLWVLTRTPMRNREHGIGTIPVTRDRKGTWLAPFFAFFIQTFRIKLGF